MIILASKSPRRKELLSLCGIEFSVMPTEADETLPENISPAEAVEHLSRIKAEPLKNENGIIIGADTVVAIDDIILGKPRDEKDAFDMLKALSGKTHFVYTGVTIIKGEKSVTFSEKTEVEFFPLSDEEIADYVKTGEPLDKAGAYGIQGKGALLVKKINGDYNNVVGLPVSRLSRELKNFE